MVQLQILALSISHASAPNHNKTHTWTNPPTKRTPGEPLIPTKCKQCFFFHQHGSEELHKLCRSKPIWWTGPEGVGPKWCSKYLANIILSLPPLVSSFFFWVRIDMVLSWFHKVELIMVCLPNCIEH